MFCLKEVDNVTHDFDKFSIIFRAVISLIIQCIIICVIVVTLKLTFLGSCTCTVSKTELRIVYLQFFFFLAQKVYASILTSSLLSIPYWFCDSKSSLHTSSGPLSHAADSHAQLWMRSGTAFPLNFYKVSSLLSQNMKYVKKFEYHAMSAFPSVLRN